MQSVCRAEQPGGRKHDEDQPAQHEACRKKVKFDLKVESDRDDQGELFRQ
jgi:hypothetical protein